MKFVPTLIPEVLIIEPTIIGDQRGFFMETYQTYKFAAAGIRDDFIQDNHSGSQENTLRGLHYQIRHPQGKLVRVIQGEIFDVAVDIRRNSPTFGKWVGVGLSSENKKQLWVPPGFAHGFYVTSPWAEVVYKVTDIYAPKHERTIAWDDPDIGIRWPIEPGVKPLLSEKDLVGKPLKDAEIFDE
jgi:dTDP-4-dehydrorhamnose 3,5-epimerase